MEQLLTELAAQLGTTVEFLWGVLLYQAKVEAIKSLTQLILMLSFLLVVWRLIALMVDKLDKTESAVMRMVSFFVLIALALFAIGINVNDAIDVLFNPEYWALQQILEVIK